MTQTNRAPRITSKTVAVKTTAASKAAPESTPAPDRTPPAATTRRGPTLEGVLTGLEARARAAQSVSELGFSIANETHGVFRFRQALVLRGPGPNARLMTVSGLAKPTEDSPYLVWLRRAWAWLQPQVLDEQGWFAPQDPESIPEAIIDGWREWWTDGVLVWPLRARSGQILAWVIFVMERPPGDWQLQALERLSQTWGYCWEMVGGISRHRSWFQGWKSLGRLRLVLILAIAAGLGLIPIRQTVLAPAEVISLDARVVAAPLDGVIKTIHVRPNQFVNADDVLFSLDDTVLRNRYDVTRESVAVADAELVAASQRVFQDPATQSEIALLTGRAHERRAELEAIRRQLSRIHVTAEDSGAAVFGDPDDWLGRPVRTGERIMLLADPEAPGMLIHLPVSEALTLETGATVKLFLTASPLDPLEGEITETSYQAAISPDGIASYRLRAKFDEGVTSSNARIGLQGTAKLYGDTVTLAYYLFRRPLAAVREWTGW